MFDQLKNSQSFTTQLKSERGFECWSYGSLRSKSIRHITVGYIKVGYRLQLPLVQSAHFIAATAKDNFKNSNDEHFESELF